MPKWIFYLIPPVAVGAYLLFRPSEKKTPYYPVEGPSNIPPKQLAASGIRAQKYLMRMEGGLAAWRAVSFIPGLGEGKKVLALSTLDVVTQMAAVDAAAGRIFSGDMTKIKLRADQIRKEVAA